ncbi:MAG: ABC transporter permease, partial [Clostridiales bacterium]|nr:ABC transporter permease [Clostridiales bacterium]
MIGSKTEIDKSYNLDRHYTVVGILKSDSYISFIGSPEVNSKNLNYNEQGYLVFPNKGHFAEAESEIASLSSKGLTVWTLSLYKKLFQKNSQTFKILDTMVILAIIVMVVCLVCSKYAQYFSRKKEIGTLSALGYTQDEITKRLAYEVIFTNLLGFFIGLVLATVLSKVFVVRYFESIGGTGVYLYGKAAVLALLAPMFTTIFTLMPVCHLIRRVDAISIVESN